VPSESRGSATGTGVTTASQVLTVPPPGPQSYLLVSVVTNDPAVTITSITGGTGTFVRATFVNTAATRLELWVGYNFGQSAPTSITITKSLGAPSGMNYVFRVIDVLADTSVAPTFTVSTSNTATSTAPDSGVLTPAVGDILMAACVINSNAGSSTARTHTGNAYLQNTGANYGVVVRTEMGWCEAVAAVSSKEVWTIPSFLWAAVQVKWTPPASPTPTSALLLKGLTTQAADAASSY
jgi:hypothetical protein